MLLCICRVFPENSVALASPETPQIEAQYFKVKDCLLTRQVWAASGTSGEESKPCSGVTFHCNPKWMNFGSKCRAAGRRAHLCPRHRNRRQISSLVVLLVVMEAKLTYSSYAWLACIATYSISTRHPGRYCPSSRFWANSNGSQWSQWINADPMDPTLMCLQQCLLGIRAKEGSNQEREDSQGAYLARCK